jgi:GAF domain-containing protein
MGWLVSKDRQPRRGRPSAARRESGGAGPDRRLVQRIMDELHTEDRQALAGETPTGRRSMDKQWCDILVDRLERGDSLEQIDHDLRHIPGLSEEERAMLWLLALGEHQRRTSTREADERPGDHAPAPSSPRRFAERRKVIVSVLELARTETAMDVAVLGEIRHGRETARLLAGDAQSFGLELGWSMAVEESYCQRLLEGRLSNIVPDTRANEHVRDLAVTRAAGIGAYIGVPLSTLNARLYILCCLAHEQRPSLSRRDVVLLRGLGETIAAELDAAPID